MTQTIIILSIIFFVGYLIYRKYKKPTTASKELSIIDEYKLAKKETADFDAKYENDMAQSLEFDFEKYRNNFDDPKDGWYISRFDSTEFMLRKNNDSTYVTIEINYKREGEMSQIINSFKIKEIARTYSSENRYFESKRMKCIAEKYFFLYKLKKEVERKNKKIADVQITLDIIGKSSSRDAKINDILN